MSINGINPLLPQSNPIQSVGDAVKSSSSVSNAKGSFADVFESAMKEVNELQTKADEQIEGITLKTDGVTPHTAMVALEKADVAFQLMSAIRGKIIRAYEEVIRTQV
jgi:flagellar hook-basal body complex protein FliE